MKLDTIKDQLQGYFINQIQHNNMKVNETLCKKISNTEYLVLDNVNTPNGLVSAMDNLLYQINCQILNPTISIVSLNEILPTINGTVFEHYKMREKTIEKHISWCECVETEANKLSKDRYVVKWKRPKGFAYAIVYDDTLTEINDVLLEDQHKESAVRIKYPKLLLKALQDDLNNEFETLYSEEVKKYQSI